MLKGTKDLRKLNKEGNLKKWMKNTRNKMNENEMKNKTKQDKEEKDQDKMWFWKRGKNYGVYLKIYSSLMAENCLSNSRRHTYVKVPVKVDFEVIVVAIII